MKNNSNESLMNYTQTEMNDMNDMNLKYNLHIIGIIFLSLYMLIFVSENCNIIKNEI